MLEGFLLTLPEVFLLLAHSTISLLETACSGKKECYSEERISCEELLNFGSLTVLSFSYIVTSTKTFFFK